MDTNEISLEELIMFQENEANDITTIVDPVEEKPIETEIETETEEETEEEEIEETEETVEETEEETKPEPEETETEVEEESEDTEENSIQNYYDHLKENNFLMLPDDYKFDGTAENLEEAFKQSEEAKLEAVKTAVVNSIPEDGKHLLKYLVSGGNLQEYVKTALPIDADSMDLNNVSHQRKIVAEHFRQTTNYKDEKIEKMLNRLADMDALQETAEESLPELKEIETNKQQQLADNQEQAQHQAKLKAQEDKNNFQKAIVDTQFIPGKRKNKVKAFMFNEISRDGNTNTDYNRVLSQISSKPEHVVQLADILMDYSTEKGFSMERFERRGKSKANTSFRKSLEAKIDPKSKVSGKSNIKPEENVDWEALLTQLG